jgi:tripartite-type tricarboxylate transporter receptor subunit TctC
MLRSLTAAALTLCAGAVLATSVRAEDLADFYKGKTITIVCSSSPGGGYDTLARAVARHLGKHIPGNPTVVVKNLPGAGGIVATNNLFNNAEKDGTVIGLVQNNTPFEPLFGTKNARYEPTKFNWLGSPSVETGILVVWSTVPVNSMDDIKKHPITVGAAGINSTPAFYTRLLNEVFGTQIKPIAGYPGQTEAFLAMERGELDGYPSVFYTTLQATKPEWLPQKKIKAIIQYGPEKEKELADVPYAPDLVTSAEDKILLEAAFAPLALGRPFLMPPGVPADRVTAMRKAMSDTFVDPEYVAEAIKTGLGAATPRNGEQIQQVIDKTYSSPPAVLERLKKIYAAGG